MKSFILLFVFISGLQCAFGQYKQNKLNYNYKEYTFQYGDPYNPTVTGIASFLIPGLGQVVAGETGRGIAFFAGYAVSYGIFLNGASRIIEFAEENPNFSGGRIEGLGGFVFGVASVLVTTIWSTSDAVRVAKVNNLAFRDRTNKTSFKIEPLLFNSPNSTGINGGIQLKVKF